MTDSRQFAGASTGPTELPAVAPAGRAAAPGSHRAKPPRASRSFTGLIDGIIGNLSTLVRKESASVKAEGSNITRQAMKGVGVLGGAVSVSYFVGLFLSVGLWWTLASAVGRSWSGLIVAGLWGLVAVVLVRLGRQQLVGVRREIRTAETWERIVNGVAGIGMDAESHRSAR